MSHGGAVISGPMNSGSPWSLSSANQKRLRGEIKKIRLQSRKLVLTLLSSFFTFVPIRTQKILGFGYLRLVGLREREINVHSGRNLQGLTRKAELLFVDDGQGGLRLRKRFTRSNFVAIYGHPKPSLWVPIVTASTRGSNKKNLLICGRDATFPRQVDKRFVTHDEGDMRAIEQLLNSRRFETIFCENLDSDHPGLQPIPTGLVPYQYNMPNVRKIRFSPAPNANRQWLALCAHRLHTGAQFNERRTVTELCRNGSWAAFSEVLDKPVSQIQFQKLLSKASFTYCVNGGGIDPSPKAMEALVAGSIPIMKRSTVSEAYKDLPVFFVDSWDERELTKDILLDVLNEYSKQGDFWERVLTFSSEKYWLKRVSNPQAR